MGSTLSVQPTTEAVREQLARILSSSLFKHSRHYPALLRYVVEQSLAGRSSHLKERALGVEVFGRESNYDTNLDPVVRTCASEVRKRIAQYYHDESHALELRIELPSGSYVPEFRFPEPPPIPSGNRESPINEPAIETPSHPTRLLRARYGALGVIAALLMMGVAVANLRPRANPVAQFWEPIWSSANSALVCVSPPGEQLAGNANPSYLDVMHADRMAFADALTMARITGLFRENGYQVDIRRGSNVTLEDFRRGPSILIGGYNNPWTLRLADQLRFTFQRDPGGREGIIHDRLNPSKIVWHHDSHVPYSQLNQDYAIVSRFVDAHTERMVLVVAGMGRDGTTAAGEFITQQRYLKMLADVAPKGWEHRNLQVVLTTEIINGNVGPPRIAATYFW